MHSSTMVQCAHLVPTLAPCTPGRPCTTTHPGSQHSTYAPRHAGESGMALGSLPSAPVDTMARLVTCPVKQPCSCPLIGTPVPAPGVTLTLAITGSNVMLTLLWSTLLSYV